LITRGYGALPFGTDRVVIAFASVWANSQVLAKDDVYDTSRLNGRCRCERIAAVSSCQAGFGNTRLLHHLLYIHVKWLAADAKITLDCKVDPEKVDASGEVTLTISVGDTVAKGNYVVWILVPIRQRTFNATEKLPAAGFSRSDEKKTRPEAEHFNLLGKHFFASVEQKWPCTDRQVFVKKMTRWTGVLRFRERQGGHTIRESSHGICRFCLELPATYTADR
jgi:hypothetical protein